MSTMRRRLTRGPPLGPNDRRIYTKPIMETAAVDFLGLLSSPVKEAEQMLVYAEHLAE